MKKFALLTATIALGLFSMSTTSVRAAFVATNTLVTSFQLMAVAQKPNSPTMTTNRAGVVTTAFTTITNRLTTSNILVMIETEFGTNFPAGAKLCYSFDTEGFAVLDKNGTFLLDVGSNPSDSNYSFVLTNTVSSEGPGVIMGRFVENVAAAKTSETIHLFQADEAIFYKDSHGNDFHFSGLSRLSVSGSVNGTNAPTSTMSVSIIGTGGGTYYSQKFDTNVSAVFTHAEMDAAGKNVGFGF